MRTHTAALFAATLLPMMLAGAVPADAQTCDADANADLTCDGTATFGSFSSTAMGAGTTATGLVSTAMGNSTEANGDRSTAMGNFTSASGDFSTAMGDSTTASGPFSTAMGFGTEASGDYSTTMGLSTLADARSSVAIGESNVGGGDPNDWVATDPLFEIGNGTLGATNNAFTVLKNGNTGINTYFPERALDVQGQMQVVAERTDFSPHFIMENTSLSNGFVGFRLLSKDASIDFNNASGRFRLNWDDGDPWELQLEANGDLTIAGSLIADGSTFPDYVFEDGYVLMTLPEVAAYIAQNRKLPGFPSAAETDARGVDMTRVQKLLVEKVEELTLYAIQQHDLVTEQERMIQEQEHRLEEQRAANAGLELRMAALEAQLAKLAAR